MTFTPPTDDICVQEGTFAFSFKASGTVYAGQAVTAYGTMQCEVAANADDAFIGVPEYTTTNGNMVAVYGPGNIVRMVTAATSVAAGDDVMISGSEGKVSNAGLAAGTKIGVALETQGTAGGAIRILLV